MNKEKALQKTREYFNKIDFCMDYFGLGVCMPKAVEDGFNAVINFMEIDNPKQYVKIYINTNNENNYNDNVEVAILDIFLYYLELSDYMQNIYNRVFAKAINMGNMLIDKELYATQYTIRMILEDNTRENAIKKLNAILRADQLYIVAGIRPEVYKQERELVIYTLSLLQ